MEQPPKLRGEIRILPKKKHKINRAPKERNQISNYLYRCVRDVHALPDSFHEPGNGKKFVIIFLHTYRPPTVIALPILFPPTSQPPPGGCYIYKKC